MIFNPTPLESAYIIGLEKKSDERGFFGRVFCQREFQEHGLVSNFCQINNSLSRHKGTLRGLHYQLPPKAETKLVRCIRGALYDLILDLRADSPTFGESFAAELTAENRIMMYVPKGFAHGFITLVDDTEAFYLADQFYSPEHERGVRYDDPTFSMRWPTDVTIVSDKDRSYRNFESSWHLTLG